MTGYDLATLGLWPAMESSALRFGEVLLRLRGRSVTVSPRYFAPKSPQETRLYSADFGALMTIGTTITSAIVTVTGATSVVGSQFPGPVATTGDSLSSLPLSDSLTGQAMGATVAGLVTSLVVVAIAGGIDGTVAEVDYLVSTSDGQVIARLALMPIIQAIGSTQTIVGGPGTVAAAS